MNPEIAWDEPSLPALVWWRGRHVGTQITGGPDRVSNDAPKEPPQRRYVGFAEPVSPPVVSEGVGSSIPGVW